MPDVKRLLVLNNYNFISKIYNEFDEIHFAPVYRSKVQKGFFDRRYKLLKSIYPKVKWTEEFELKKDDKVLAWDAHNEKKAFGSHLLNYQNRLFDDEPMINIKSFTPFKDLVGKKLPERFEGAIDPIDTDLLKHLSCYFEEKKLASTYFETRNGLVGKGFSTNCSAFLSCGALDVKFLYNKVKAYELINGSNKSTYWIIFELLWREFFYWHYQQNSEYYFSYKGLNHKRDFSLFKRYEVEELKQFKTHAFFKAALNELVETGFMSNRSRQIFASIWINDLELDWRSGAYLFEEYLIDYDVYSNYGNWMYLAGVGVDPRGKRYFNTDKQLLRYDPENLYIKHWLRGNE